MSRVARGLIALSACLLVLLWGVLISCAVEDEGQSDEVDSEATHHMGAMHAREPATGPGSLRIETAVVEEKKNGFDTSCKHVKFEESDRIKFRDEPPPVGHLHEFFGTNVDYDSTLQEMHQGASNCNREEDTSGAWIMALKRPDGTNVRPVEFKIYYRTAIPDPAVPPENLKIIAGDGLSTIPQDKQITKWDCKDTETKDLSGSSPEPYNCPTDNGRLRLHVTFPQCEALNANGTPKTDSEDHKSHMAYPTKKDGVVKCPESHPHAIVRTGFQIAFPSRAEKNSPDYSRVTLASGGRYGAHADWWQSFRMTGDNGFKHLIERCFAPGAYCKLGNEPI